MYIYNYIYITINIYICIHKTSVWLINSYKPTLQQRLGKYIWITAWTIRGPSFWGDPVSEVMAGKSLRKPKVVLWEY